MKKPINVFSYNFQNSANDEIDIHIDGDIVDASTQAVIEAWFGDTTSTSYKSFRNAIDKQSAKVYNIYINSVGGHVGDAMAIHDYIKDLQQSGKIVNTKGRGIVASSATFILLASDNAEMSANSWFMMHNVSGGIFGTVDQVENYARTMRQFNDQIRDLYAKKTGMRKEEVSKLMDKETWLNAEQAKEKGFITSVSGEVAFKNKINQEDWEFADTTILNLYNSSVKPIESNQTIEDMKKLFLDFGTTITNAIKGIKVDKDTDQTALVNSIADAVGQQMSALGEKMENEVHTQVVAALNKEENKKVITDAIANATKELTDKITALELKNEELETEIANKIGNKSSATGDKGEEIIGSFV